MNMENEEKNKIIPGSDSIRVEPPTELIDKIKEKQSASVDGQEEKKITPDEGPTRIEPSPEILKKIAEKQTVALGAQEEQRATSDTKPLKVEITLKDQAKKKITPGSKPMRIEVSADTVTRIKEKQATVQVQQELKEQPLVRTEPEPPRKMPIFFKILLVFSFLFLTVGLAMGLVALLDMPMPGFITPVVNFVGKFFIRPA